MNWRAFIYMSEPEYHRYYNRIWLIITGGLLSVSYLISIGKLPSFNETQHAFITLAGLSAYLTGLLYGELDKMRLLNDALYGGKRR